jgi:hypothetical protein
VGSQNFFYIYYSTNKITILFFVRLNKFPFFQYLYNPEGKSPKKELPAHRNTYTKGKNVGTILNDESISSEAQKRERERDGICNNVPIRTSSQIRGTSLIHPTGAVDSVVTVTTPPSASTLIRRY